MCESDATFFLLSSCMPYHYGTSSSDVEWWPDSTDDENQGKDDQTEEPESRSSSPSSDASNGGWDYDLRYVVVFIKKCLMSHYTTRIQCKGHVYKAGFGSLFDAVEGYCSY